LEPRRFSFYDVDAWTRQTEITMRILSIVLTVFIFRFVSAGTHRVPQQYARIQSAITAALPGDTVIIAPGHYYQNITLTKVLILKNASISETVTLEDTTLTPSQGYVGSSVITVDAAGPGEIIGVTLIAVSRFNVYPVGINVKKDGWTVRECSFYNIDGVQSYEANIVIRNCIFRKPRNGAVSAGKYSKVIGNRIIGNRTEGVTATQNVLIANNLFMNCSFAVNSGGEFDTVTVQNNTISSVGIMYTNNQHAIRIGWDQAPMIIRNNIIAYNNGMGIFVTAANSVVADKFTLRSNNIFMNSVNYFLADDATGLNGNIASDPLFCNNDSLFYLSSDSPCIDAGDSSMQDIDGSRSDMGITGGPYAMNVRYAPASFSLTEPDTDIVIHTNTDPYTVIGHSPLTVRWNHTFDRDNSGKLRYRFLIGTKVMNTCRTTACNTPSLTEIIDTVYADTNFIAVNVEKYPPRKYFFTVEAVDGDGLVKRADEVRAFTVIKENLYALDFQLEQNYPNPFNASTSIRYGLPYTAVISIILYDVLGREVKVIERGPKSTGYHFASVNSTTLSSGVYYYVMRMHAAVIPIGAPVETELPLIKKMTVVR
jgi:hypothetical protein